MSSGRVNLPIADEASWLKAQVSSRLDCAAIYIRGCPKTRNFGSDLNSKGKRAIIGAKGEEWGGNHALSGL